MKIGIVNSGNIGRTLAAVWHESGHRLKLAKAGDQTKLHQFLTKVPGAEHGTPKEAADFGDVVLFSVYWPNLDSTLTEVGNLDGKIVIDTMNALKVNEEFEHSHDLEFMKSSSTAEELQHRLPNAKVVKAFSTLPAGILNSKEWEKNVEKPPIFVASDDDEAKATVFQLVRDAGFNPVDAGSLVAARSIEQIGVLLHHVGENHYGGQYDRLAPTFLQAKEAS